MEIDWYTTGWLLAVYTIGTYFGYRMAYRKNFVIISETIDGLKKGGFLKVKETGDDNYEILKVKQND